MRRRGCPSIETRPPTYSVLPLPLLTLPSSDSSPLTTFEAQYESSTSTSSCAVCKKRFLGVGRKASECPDALSTFLFSQRGPMPSLAILYIYILSPARAVVFSRRGSVKHNHR